MKKTQKDKNSSVHLSAARNEEWPWSRKETGPQPAVNRLSCTLLRFTWDLIRPCFRRIIQGGCLPVLGVKTRGRALGASFRPASVPPRSVPPRLAPLRSAPTRLVRPASPCTAPPRPAPPSPARPRRAPPCPGSPRPVCGVSGYVGLQMIVINNTNDVLQTNR